MSIWRTRGLAVIVGALSLALVASGCTSSGSTAKDPDAVKDELVLGIEADIPGWDPGKLLPGSVAWAAQAVYDSLLTCDETGNISPGLAESYEFTDSNTKLTLQIRE